MAGGAVLVAGLMTVGAGVSAADPVCLTAGTSGFSAAVVATSGETIANRTVVATGCDVGIYIGDGATDVTVDGVTVTGANAAGILVEDTSGITIMRSKVYGNGFHAQPAPEPPGTPPVEGQLPQAFAISLFGVSDSIVTRNYVHHNGRGGIGVMDDGPSGPGRVVGSEGFPTHPIPVSNVVVSRNTLKANYSGCAIVVSAFNPGNTVKDVMVTRNTVIGTGFAQGTDPEHPLVDVGGIVAQSNGPFSTVSNITISRNTVKDSVEGGVIVHAAAPGSHTAHVTVTRNVLSGNNLGFNPPPSEPRPEVDNTVGVVVSVVGPPAGALVCPPGVTAPSPFCFENPGETNDSTVVSWNTITDQYYGVWTSGANPPKMFRNNITATEPYFQVS
jgi:hypothetical protein